jgi:hypothetical protein
MLSPMMATVIYSLIGFGLSIGLLRNQDWYTVDSSRGSTKGLATNTNAAETTSSSSTKDFQSFNTDGFTVGTPEDTNACNSIGTNGSLAVEMPTVATTASNYGRHYYFYSSS